MIVGKKGFDFENPDVSYGGNIYRSYTERVSDYGNDIGQGNTTNIFISELQGGYILNPVTNLQLFAGLTYRSFDQLVQNNNSTMKNTTWFTVGLKADLFNWYFDF